MRRAVRVLVALVAVLALIAVAAIWWLGPTYGALMTGKPIFIGRPSVHKYATTAFDIAEIQGIYASSDRFRQTKAQAEQDIRNAQTYPDTYDAIDRVLKAAGGKHSALIKPTDNVPGSTTNTELPSATRHGGVVTLRVPEVARGEIGARYATTGSHALTEALNDHACGVMLDLRGNGGGDVGPMLAAVSPVLPDGTVLQFVSGPGTTTDVVVTGNAVKGGGTPTSVEGAGKFRVPVALLTDGATASSGEATLLSFRGLDNARTFGAPTAGYASANVVIDMPDGAALMLTVAKDRARTGEDFAEDPIPPDTLAADAESAAVAWLAERGCR